MSIPNEKSDLEEILFTVFSNYSTPAASPTGSCIKLQKFITLCSDSKIINNHTSIRALDLLFRSLTNKSSFMTFPVFIQTTLKISELKQASSPSQSSANFYIQFIQSHFVPLAETILAKRAKIFEVIEKIQPQSLHTLHTSAKYLKNIYVKVFHYEIKAADDLAGLAYKRLESWLKEIEIFPGLISRNKLAVVWNDLVLMNRETDLAKLLLPDGCADIGDYFKFSEFLALIYICSELAYADSQVAESANDKLVCLLERIEFTQDFNSSRLISSPKESTLARSLSHYSLYSSRSSSFALLPMVEDLESRENLKGLRSLFLNFACSSTSSDKKVIKPQGFIKLLEKVGVIKKTAGKGLSIVEADLIFSKVAGSRSADNKRQLFLDYSQFIQAVGLLGRKIFNTKNEDEAFDSFIQKFIEPLENDLLESKISKINDFDDSTSILNSNEFIQLASLLKKPLNYYYKVYSNKLFLMNSSGFLRFCRDFEIFPDIISKNSLLSIFDSLSINSSSIQRSFSYSRMTETPRSPSEGVLNEDSFIQALCMISLNVSYEIDNYDTNSKICWFFERLNQSNGVNKVLKSYGHARLGKGEAFDLTVGLRLKFPDFFNRFESKKLSFNDLASSINLCYTSK